MGRLLDPEVLEDRHALGGTDQARRLAGKFHVDTGPSAVDLDVDVAHCGDHRFVALGALLQELIVEEVLLD